MDHAYVFEVVETDGNTFWLVAPTHQRVESALRNRGSRIRLLGRVDDFIRKRPIAKVVFDGGIEADVLT